MTRMPRRWASSISSHGVGQHAVDGLDGEEVADVVAAVAEGRRVEGQQPEAVDAQPLQVVEALRQPSQVTVAVAARVVEASGRRPRRRRRAGTSRGRRRAGGIGVAHHLPWSSCTVTGCECHGIAIQWWRGDNLRREAAVGSRPALPGRVLKEDARARHPDLACRERSTVLRFDGELTTDGRRRRPRRHAPGFARAGRLVVDLGGVRRVDRPGLAALVGAADEGQGQGSRSVAVRCCRPIGRRPPPPGGHRPPVPPRNRRPSAASPGRAVTASERHHEARWSWSPTACPSSAPMRRRLGDEPGRPGARPLGTLRQGGGAWVGWAGSAGDAAAALRARRRPAPAAGAVGATSTTGFYEGFSNEALWPLYHDAIRPSDVRPGWWDAYVTVNERFAEAAAEVGRAGRRRVGARLPAAARAGDAPRAAPRRPHRLLPPHPVPARRSCSCRLPWRERGARGPARRRRHRLPAPGRGRELRRRRPPAARRRTATCPMLQARPPRRPRRRLPDLDRRAASSTTLARMPETRRAGAGSCAAASARPQHVLLGVDRLDYTKGIVERLAGLRARCCEDGPRSTARDTVMVQLAVPTRGGSEHYAEERAPGRAAGRVDQRPASAASATRPCTTCTRACRSRSSCALYQAADVMLVTPLATG